MAVKRPDPLIIFLVILIGLTGVTGLIIDPIYSAVTGLVLAITALALLLYQQMRSDLSLSQDTLKLQLLRLLEEPGSEDCFTSLIEEIQKCINSEQSVFLKCEPSHDNLEILANTGSRNSWVDFLSNRLLEPGFQVLSDHRDGNPVWAITATHPNTGTIFSILAKRENNRKAKKRELSFLTASTEMLGEIYIATNRALLGQRHALHAERATISRELHDSLAQSLSYLKIQIARIQLMLNATDTRFGRDDLNEVVAEVRENLNIAYRHLRELITTFRLTMDGRDLAHALDESIEEFAHRSSIAFELDNRLMGNELSVEQEIQVLHICRETLSNMVRHSHAQKGRIILETVIGGEIQLSAIDDGVGLNNNKKRSRFHGMLIMQERAHRLKGDMWIHEPLGGGTRIDVRFPGMGDKQAAQAQPELVV